MGGVDLAVVAIFLAATCLAGTGAGRGGGPADDEYLLAGRSLSLPAFVVALVATWYGGVLGVGEYAYTWGLSNWVVLGVPYYVGALLFMALFAGRARRSGRYTVPDTLFETYGRAAGITGTAVVFVLSLPAAYLLMLGVLLRRMTGLDQSTAIVLSALFCVAYIVARGFRSVVRTKWLQFALMYGAFVLLLPVAVRTAGGWGFLEEQLPPDAFTWHGGRDGAYVAAWYFIALQTLVEPTFFQRAYAARSPQVARYGILVAVGCMAAFDALTTFTGMYARAILPGLPSGMEAFPALGEALLPPVLLGLFYAGLVATILSTVDSFLFVGGVTVGRDLAWRLTGGRADQLWWTRLGLLAAAALSTLVALASESVVNLWYGFGSVGTAVLLPPLLGAFHSALRPAPSFATAGMLLSGAVTAAWLGGGFLAPDGRTWLGLEPIYPGLLVAVTVHAAGIAARRLRA